MQPQESIEKTEIRNANTAMSEPPKIQTSGGTLSIRAIIGHNRQIKVRVSGRGVRSG